MFIDGRKLPKDEPKFVGAGVAGSSVFSTGAYANPTLIIVALAIRLADHLKMFIELYK